MGFRYIADLQLRRLEVEKKIQRRRQKEYAELVKEMEELAKMIRSLDEKQVDFKDLLKVMSKAMKVLALVQLHWGTLQEFFNAVAVKVNLVMAGGLATFTNMAARSLGFEHRRHALSEMILESTALVQVSQSLSLVSAIYVHMSKTYVVAPMGDWTGIVAMSEQEQKKMLRRLSDNCAAASARIQQLAAEQRTRFGPTIQSQIDALKQRFDIRGKTDDFDVEKWVTIPM